MKHNLMMIIGCVLPLLLIFILPLFGVRGDVGIFGFIVLMFLCHLFMMREMREDKGGGHGRHSD